MDGKGDRFPVGMRVLVVDDNLACLRILERLLLNCNFNVTNQAVRALQMLRENKEKFDIVISDVHMPDMDGFKLLELIGLELDLPVIMLSANDDPKLVMKGVRHGAVDYLLKPVRIQDLKNIWQHVVRKNRFSQQKGKAVSDSETGDDGQVTLLADGNGNLEQEETVARKRKDIDSTTEDGGGEGDEEDECNADAATQKKARLHWTAELHKKFVAAVDELGPQKAFPKKILDVMNVDGLTRENVASHLQKYRLYLKRVSVSSSKSSDAFVNPFRHYDSSIYPSERSPLNPYSALCSLNGGLEKPSVASTPAPCHVGFQPGLSHSHSSLGRFMVPKQNVKVPRLMGMDQFRHQNSSRAILGRSPTLPLQTSSVAAPSGSIVPTLMDYTKNMEKWQGGISSRYTPHNDPLTSFNACKVGYSTVQLQALQELKNRSSKISSASNNPLVPAIDPSGQGFGHNYPLQYNSFHDSSFGAPSLVQNAEVHEGDADALMRLDDHYLVEDTELLAEFTQDNSGTLDDIVTGFFK